MTPATLTDTRRWPLAVVRYSDAYGDGEVRAFVADVAALVGRNEPFALAIVTHPAQFARELPPETHRAYALGVKGHRDAMRRLCRGVAFVVADPERRAAYAAKVARDGPKVFGAPMRAFTTLSEAEAWLNARLSGGDAPPAPDTHTQEAL